MDKSIYLLPGRGGHLNKGLGKELSARGYVISGRELNGEFQKLRFGEQVKIVANDLKTNFWHKDAKVIANSFGAYLFLHAQSLLAPYIGSALLLSPIVGEAEYEEKMMFFVPPLAGHLQSLVKNGSYPVPTCCEIHVGEHDWQSNPMNVVELATPLGIKVSVVPNAGHALEPAYVSRLLGSWLVA
ncbi:hypothetical protein ACMHYO_22550 [Allopusillimonas ginsengisoli]|uniref:hypothetical protein n=1 Tax=Allopusillimonas ginsengisoli TaxID=453575 RepID=UPI0010C1922E|nr:hypothetical protein D7I39_12875 [Allopusillimonas ginsengisoli]